MLRIIKLITFLSIFLLVSYPVTKNIKSNFNDIIIPSKTKQNIDKMIGQMIMVGFKGLYINNLSKIIQDIKAGKIGGVILLNKGLKLKSNFRNIRSKNQVIKLIKNLKKYSKYPLLVAIDQEGGKISRLKEIPGFEKSVSQKYLGTIKDINFVMSVMKN